MSFAYSNPASAYPSSSSGGGNRTHGRGHYGHSLHRPRVNGIDHVQDVSPPPPPPSSSSMAALLSASGTRHRGGIGIESAATRVDRLVVHPTAPPLPYSHNGTATGHTSSSTHRITSRFWTNPTSSTPAFPATPSTTTTSSFFSARPSNVRTPSVFPATPHRTQPQVSLPMPAQTPRVSSTISSPPVDLSFVPATPASSALRPFSTRGSAVIGAHHPLQHSAFASASRAVSVSPRPSKHSHNPPPQPPPSASFERPYGDQVGPHHSPCPSPRPTLPPPANDVIADFRARLNRQPNAAQGARQSHQSAFSWDTHRLPAAVSAPQRTSRYGHDEPEEETNYEEPQAVGSNVFSALSGHGTRTHNPPFDVEHVARPAHCGPPPPPPAMGPPMHQAQGMVPATVLAMRNGGRLPVKPVSDLPPRFRGMFSFPYFNYIQTQCYDVLMHSDTNLVTSSPTGSGKTALLDLALIRLWSTHPTSRAVYLAPTKALCSERAADWTRRLQPLGITVAELTGDTSLFDARGAQSAQLLVITSEKYDAVTRRWRESARTRQFVAQVGLVLLDEVHLLASSRGSTLEALVARMKVVSAELKTRIRYIALSATFPNIEDVGKWLGGGAKVFTFGDEYRPVRLERLVLGYSTAHRSSWQFDKVLDAHLPNVIREHAVGKPALVFCATRKATEATAKLLVADGGGIVPGSMGHLFVRTSQHARALVEAAQRVRNQAARELVVHGVAFHHAGVEMADRQLIEQLFLAGQLLVLCTTSTLAVGVNLPAYLVVLKGTQSWMGGEMKEYAPMDVLQMLGRAGRPQFETSGKAIIMTTSNKVDEYESLVAGRTVVESSLHLNLIEHLNAEIAQGTITNEQLAVQWLESTFLYVRLRAAPFYYANVVHGSDNLRQLVASTLQVLRAAEMVRESQLTPEAAAAVGPRLECTEYGKLMSRYCLSLQTMQALMAGGPSIPQQLYAMALASEFSGTYVKAGDKTMLADLNKMQGIKFRLPDKYKYKSTADKVYLVVQAVLGSVQLQGKDLDRLRVFVSCEQGNIWSALGRIAAAAVELHVARRDTVPYAADRIRHAILLLQSVRTKIWFDSTRLLRQVDKLGPVLTSTLAEAGITTFAELASAPAWRLEQLCRRNPPFGSGLVTAANQFPHLGVLGRLLQSTLLLSVNISNAATCKKGPHGSSASWVHVLVHDEVGKLLFHDRVTLYDLAKAEYKARVTLPPGVHCVFASLLAEDYVGLDVHLQADPRTRQVSVMPRWLLPESAFAAPDTSAEFVPAATQLPGPLPPPSADVGPSNPAAPLFGPSTQPMHRVPPLSAAQGSMMPYQPPAPPAPSQFVHDAAQSLCKHKCKDRYKCKHACCKRGLPERPASPIQAAKPQPKPRKKQLTLEQILQGIPEPVVVLSDSEVSDDDYGIMEALGRTDAPKAFRSSALLPARKLTPPPPPLSTNGLDLEHEWDDLDDSVFFQAASLDVPQLMSASATMTQASASPAHTQAPREPFVPMDFDTRHLAHGRQQLTPPHTDTPSGDRLPAEQNLSLASASDRRAAPPQSQFSAREPTTAMAHRPDPPTLPALTRMTGTSSNRASNHGFRFRADLLPRVASGASAGSV